MMLSVHGRASGLNALPPAVMTGVAFDTTYLDTDGNAVSKSLCQPVAANPWYCSVFWTQACRCLPVGSIVPGLPSGYDSVAGSVDPNNTTGETQTLATTGIGIPTTAPYPFSGALVTAGDAASNAAKDVAKNVFPWLPVALITGAIILLQKR